MLNLDSGGGGEVSQEGYVCGVAEWTVILKRKVGGSSEGVCMPDPRVRPLSCGLGGFWEASW